MLVEAEESFESSAELVVSNEIGWKICPSALRLSIGVGIGVVL